MDLQQTLFVSDMDDTLFDNSKRVSKINKNAIEEFKNAGGIFTVATGRSIMGFSSHQKELGLDVPVILYNGSCIYDYKSNEFLWVKSLDESIKNYVEIIMEHFPQMGVHIMTRKIYVCHPTPLCKENILKEKLSFIEVADIREVQEPWIKVEFILDLVNVEEVLAYIKEKPIAGCRCIRTGEHTLEIVDASVSKGDAVLRLQKVLNAKDRKLCCIGDHNNDYEMICIADIGFAVENALERIKNNADIVVTDNEHDAIANAIEIIKKI